MTELTSTAGTLRRRVLHPIAFPLWMLARLPAAWFAGVRVEVLDAKRCVASVPYGWRSTNPFRSTYFAAQAMAAEMSTGALVLLAAEQAGGGFATLIVDMRATFGKKATGTARFTCEGGAEAFAACAEARASGTPRTVALETVGRLADGTEVSRFEFRWSVKARG
ncbi:MAG: hypothetical protein RLZZ299_2576 [Pseudomonadota bacterium]